MTHAMKIMTAVDLSEYSAAAVRYSVWLAMKIDAELVLTNVINQRDVDLVQRSMAGYETFSFQNYLSDQEKERKTKMKDLFEAVSPGTVKCRYLVQTGVPYRKLLSAIESEKPILMVVSTKGRSDLADAVVGSTARKIYRRSPIPLLTIPAGFNELP